MEFLFGVCRQAINQPNAWTRDEIILIMMSVDSISREWHGHSHVYTKIIVVYPSVCP